ncbi:MAG: recombination-associated protein RdgC [Zoogloeaceae bacterium]|jgi:recombination associated protein RdgC|nr:recombination-associated protein RdgC [Zoogloeaceae bacterium]
MLFKNLQIYRLKNWPVTIADLEKRLAAHQLAPCGSGEFAVTGWVSPRQDDAFVSAIAGQWLIAFGVEARLLPAAVVREEVAALAAVFVAENGYRPGRKQMREWADEVTRKLLPRAFIRRRRTLVWIDPANGWVGIDAASRAKAEEVLELLHKTFDHLPLALLHTARSPTSAMSDWLANEEPVNFTIDMDCELRDVSGDGSIVRYARYPLWGSDVRDYVTSGKLPTRLAMTFDKRVSFVFTEKLEIKRLEFLDVTREKLGVSDDAECLVDEEYVEFALMTGEFARLIPALVEALGGEA